MQQDEFDEWLCAAGGVPYVPRSITNMKERTLSAEIRKLIDNDPNLWGHSVYDTQHRYGSGWVDWVIMGPGGVAFRELKTETGRRTDKQRWVGSTLSKHGHDYAVWTPMDLHNGTIRQQLDALAAA